MVDNTIQSTQPYQVGEVVELLHSETPVVIVDVTSEGRGVSVVLRNVSGARIGENKSIGEVVHPVSPRTGWRLPPFAGTLTDEEEALAMKYILLGVPNNA